MILFIGNLNKLTTEHELKELFGGFGAIKKLRIMVDKITRRSRGYAYIDMVADAEGLKAVSQLNSSVYMERRIIVGVASTKQLTEIDWGIFQS